jgi:tetratricopeptide (TPR) repeat protein
MAMASKELAIFETRLAEWEVSHQRVSLSGDAARIISRQADRIIDAQREAADRIVVSQERGVDRVASEVSRVYDGIVELGAAFEWGFSELIWRAEQQTEALKKILDVLQAPLDTQGKELRKRAENAYANRWFDDALEDFLESERKNRYDFAVHISLGHIYFFEKKNPEKALEYYDKAVKYATPKSPQHASYGLLHKGLIHYLRADFQEAYEAVLRATNLSPNFAEAHFQCAHYCANLGRYDEAIEHLKEATLGDRNYALKVWTEKDFDAMKEKLKSFFEQWRKAARAQAEEAIEKVKGFLSDAESYGAGHTSSYIEAKKDLSQAEALVKSASLFDCWDAILKVNAACEWTIKVPSEYEKVPPKYLSEEVEEKRSKVEKIEGRRKTRAAAAEGTVGHVPTSALILKNTFEKGVFCHIVGTTTS